MALVASLPTPVSSLEQTHRADAPLVPIVELGSSSEAIEPFKELILRSQISELRLYCTVPSWCPSPDQHLDLHDLHQLKSQFLAFIHEVVGELRASGISASYVLVPSWSSRCIICTGGCSSLATAVKQLQNVTLPHRHNVLLAEVGCPGPCLIFT